MQRRLSLFMVVSSLLALPVACSSSSSPKASDAGPGTGGASPGSGRGGSGGSGTGGATGSRTGGATGSGAGGAAGSATGGAMDSGAGGAGGAAVDAPVDAPTSVDAPMIDANTSDAPSTETAGEVGLSGPAARGQYLVKNVLGCVNCHTPQLAGGGGLDNSKFLSGVECFAKDSSGGCLNSANLTNDATGLMNLTDAQMKDALTKGIDPEGTDGGTRYLFAQMPYYQFANLSADDTDAIVSYLRTVPAVVHESPANTGTFAAQPAAAQWLPVSPADLPTASAADGGAASATNGKYLATLACATCHTQNTAATAPLQLDATMAFLGGKKYNTTIAGIDGGSVTKEIQSTNLTPDTTGLKNWTADQIVTAIRAGKDEAGRTICSPMRSFPGMTVQDATDIANYLQGIPAVANPGITETCE